MTHMPLSLPNRRDEAWKWTDVSRSVADDMRGLSIAAPVQIFVPEGVSVMRGRSMRLTSLPDFRPNIPFRSKV